MKFFRMIISLSLLFLVLFAQGCAVKQSKPRAMTRNYFEYNRGKSFPNRSDVGLTYGNNDFTLHDVGLVDESFYPDNSIIPNAFLSPLFKLKFGDALNAFTEPYYGYRLLHFLKKNPHIGIGLEFIHIKVFALDMEQRIHISGTFNGEKVDGQVRLGDYIEQLNVSHGVNHVGITFNYRLMLSPTPAIPDGRIQPFVSASFGPTAPHLELKIKDDSKLERDAYTYQWSSKNWGTGLGLGVRYKPNPHFGLYMEYKFTYSHLHGMHFDAIPGTRVTMDFFTHQIQWGLSVML